MPQEISDATMHADFVLFDPLHHAFLAWFGGRSSYIHVYNQEGVEFQVFGTDHDQIDRAYMLAFALERINSGIGYE